MDIHDIKDPSFLKKLSVKELNILSEEIRAFLIESIAKTGGHLSSNLGVVELTLAMHKVFESPKDHLLFDVGHQSYVHKILTGRAKDFNTLRQMDGLSGFLKRNESEHDVFEAGHSSTSLAAGAGMLFAKAFNPDIDNIVMLIGDGALASGMALEALNFMGQYPDKHPIIILNDNEMSISKNIGHLSKVFTKIRMKRSVRSLRRRTRKLMPRFIKNASLKIEKRLKSFISGHSYFEDLGYMYYGPLDGHDFKSLLTALTIAKQENRPCIVHVRTVKGKGYPFSEQDNLGSWHGVKPFSIDTGKAISPKPQVMSYSKVVADYLSWRADKNKAFYVITPAMVGGSELECFKAEHPQQLIDVGIAEQTAVTMASGLALKNISVFVSIYSTFLQRAYDQIHHDVARHNVHVVFGIDRAGLVGGDGETHQGIYDIPMLAHIPNMTIAHPKDAKECLGLLQYAFDVHRGPIAIRYEKVDIIRQELNNFDAEPIPPSWDIILKGNSATIITFGTYVSAFENLIKANDYPITLINARYIKPLDATVLNSIDLTKPIVVVEESTLAGGLGSMIRDYYSDRNQTYKSIKRFGFDNEFVPQGNRETMLKRYGLDAESIIDYIRETLDET